MESAKGPISKVFGVLFLLLFPLVTSSKTAVSFLRSSKPRSSPFFTVRYPGFYTSLRCNNSVYNYLHRSNNIILFFCRVQWYWRYSCRKSAFGTPSSHSGGDSGRNRYFSARDGPHQISLNGFNTGEGQNSPS
ncbi:hypothetical protein QBC42DRAFT_270005 [Cladorrhinum samala]|uniref:Uncharacterized protein n=1 Tax=Cladorrhinum samala TaxID=585594 RepID=A0AAV9HLH2_9PEZI|nr:hypothetical protein QBC42DRAFT_270005 [Cladorrhinum samala]